MPCLFSLIPFWQEIAVEDLLKSGLSSILFTDKLNRSLRTWASLFSTAGCGIWNPFKCYWDPFEEREEDENRKKYSTTSLIAYSTSIVIFNLGELIVSSIFFRFHCCKRSRLGSMMPGSMLTMRWEPEVKPKEAVKPELEMSCWRSYHVASTIYIPFIHTGMKCAKPNKYTSRKKGPAVTEIILFGTL